MSHSGIGEWFSIILTTLINYAIPIAFVVLVSIELNRIRSKEEAFQNRLDAIERRLSQSGDLRN
jgi:hypothetical protein